MHSQRLALIALLHVLLVGCAPPSAAPERPVIFAAASLSDAMVEIAEAWVATGGALPRINTAGSNVLAQQLLAAPGAADLFVSADESWLDQLESKSVLAAGGRRTLLSNRLVVIGRRGHPAPKIERAVDLHRLSDRRWVLADPAAVPAGRYARHFLELELPTAGGGAASLWDRLAGRIVPSADVRAALALVAAHDDLVGVVYRTDAAIEPDVEVLFEVPEAMGPPIRYGAAILASAPHPHLARRFLDFLAGPEAATIFERLGFDALRQQAAR